MWIYEEIMAIIKESVVINQCGRLLVGSIESAFRKASWDHDVEIQIEKTKTGWFDTSIGMRISWKGEEKAVKLFTEHAKDYLRQLGVVV